MWTLPGLEVVTEDRLRSLEGRYEDRVVPSGRVESSAIEGFWLDADWLWKRPLPSGLEGLKTILGVERI